MAVGKKYSLDEVRHFFEQKGFTLLSSTYQSKESTLEVKCPYDHLVTLSLSSFAHAVKTGTKGVGCKTCSKVAPPTIDEVRAIFETEGCYLLDETYINSFQKLSYICPNGHTWQTILPNFKRRGNKCQTCIFDSLKAKAEKLFRDNNYQLLSQFANAKTKMDCICPNGHQWSVNYANFSSGRRCIFCFGERIRVEDKVLEMLGSAGYKYFGRLNSNTSKLMVECPSGHKTSISLGSFRDGSRCADCAGNRKLRHEEIKDEIEQSGYQLLTIKTEYINSHTKVQIKCSKGHVYEVAPKDFRLGKRCRICSFRSGSDHPNWNHQITEEERIERYKRCKLLPQRQWRKKVLFRDSFTCQCCRSKTNLSAHHVNGYAEYPSIRTEVSNGITLCTDCHNSYHCMFGFRGATLEKLIQFFDYFEVSLELDLVAPPPPRC